MPFYFFIKDEQTEGATATAVESETIEEASNANANANANETGEGTSSGNQIDGTPIPDGIDPSFLASLPKNMRGEVTAEYLRILLSVQERKRFSQQGAVQNEPQAVAKVNSQSLATLPPSIQEVFAQLR